MKIVVAGSTGLVGSVLVPRLKAEGHDVLRLVREGGGEPGTAVWDPVAGTLPAGVFDSVDAVVNLCGSNVAAGRWTAVRRSELRDSRIRSTGTLVRGLAAAASRPRVLVNASAVGIYGDRGGEVLTEKSPAGSGCLARLCVDWEAEAMKASDSGTRVVCLRIGVVMSGRGGALAKMLPLFRLGLGGKLGDGRAWMSWISSEDLVRAILFVLTEPSVSGPVNAVSPDPLRNEQFAATLAASLSRRAWMPVPAALLTLAFGEMARETLLASCRALPAVLRERGFVYRFPDLPGALLDTLG